MRTAIVLKGYPRLSETFIAQEILELERRGLPITIVSLRHPTDSKTHPIHGEIRAPVTYLPEYLYKEFTRVANAWRQVRRWPTYKDAFRTWWRDLLRNPTPNRIRRFGQALVLANELPSDIEHLYAHFLHTPASVTRYTAILRGLPWSCSAHAVDIWTTPIWEIREKLDHLDWLVTCTEANVDYLRGCTSAPGKVHLAYHGLDIERFKLESPSRSGGGPIQILSVGRAVEKKGYMDLLAALASLPPDLDWRFVHIGGGPQLKRLKRVAHGWSISDRIEWRGSMSQKDVLHAYRNADIFVLASKVAKNGDRDGLPNVLMEAQSQGLACLSTRVSAIPEFIHDGHTGLLVEPGDIVGLSDSLQRLIKDSDLRSELGDAGRCRVEDVFRFDKCIESVVGLFGLSEKTNVEKVA